MSEQSRPFDLGGEFISNSVILYNTWKDMIEVVLKDYTVKVTLGQEVCKKNSMTSCNTVCTFNPNSPALERKK